MNSRLLWLLMTLNLITFPLRIRNSWEIAQSVLVLWKWVWETVCTIHLIAELISKHLVLVLDEPSSVLGTTVTSQTADVNYGLYLEGGVPSGRSGLSNLWVFQALWDSPKRLFTESVYCVSVAVLTTLRCHV